MAFSVIHVFWVPGSVLQCWGCLSSRALGFRGLEFCVKAGLVCSFPAFSKLEGNAWVVARVLAGGWGGKVESSGLLGVEVGILGVGFQSMS